MKNFDLDKLEKQNIYKTPEKLFAEVQNNVLKQTILKQNNPVQKEFKIKKIKQNTTWIYATAASLIIFVGLILFIQNPESKGLNNEAIAQQTYQNNEYETTENQEVINTIDTEYQPIKQNNVSQKKQIQPLANNIKNEVTTAPKPQKNTARKMTSSDREKAMEQVLVSFTSAELAEITTGYEMDVYLDLFN